MDREADIIPEIYVDSASARMDKKNAAKKLQQFSTPVPTKPSLLGQPTSDSITITWDVADDVSCVDNFTIFYKSLEDESDLQLLAGEWKTKDTDCKICTIGGLNSGIGYIFYVTSHTAEGMSRPSELSDVICTAKRFFPNLPKPVKLRPIFVTHQSVYLAWDVDGDASGVTSYTVICKKTNEKGTKLAYETENNIKPYLVDNLHSDTDYVFKVFSNSLRQKSESSEKSDVVRTKKGSSVLTSQSDDHHSRTAYAVDVTSRSLDRRGKSSENSGIEQMKKYSQEVTTQSDDDHIDTANSINDATSSLEDWGQSSDECVALRTKKGPTKEYSRSDYQQSGTGYSVDGASSLGKSDEKSDIKQTMKNEVPGESGDRPSGTVYSVNRASSSLESSDKSSVDTDAVMTKKDSMEVTSHSDTHHSDRADSVNVASTSLKLSNSSKKNDDVKTKKGHSVLTGQSDDDNSDTADFVNADSSSLEDWGKSSEKCDALGTKKGPTEEISRSDDQHSGTVDGASSLGKSDENSDVKQTLKNKDPTEVPGESGDCPSGTAYSVNRASSSLKSLDKSSVDTDAVMTKKDSTEVTSHSDSHHSDRADSVNVASDSLKLGNSSKKNDDVKTKKGHSVLTGQSDDDTSDTADFVNADSSALKDWGKSSKKCDALATKKGPTEEISRSDDQHSGTVDGASSLGKSDENSDVKLMKKKDPTEETSESSDPHSDTAYLVNGASSSLESSDKSSVDTDVPRTKKDRTEVTRQSETHHSDRANAAYGASNHLERWDKSSGNNSFREEELPVPQKPTLCGQPGCDSVLLTWKMSTCSLSITHYTVTYTYTTRKGRPMVFDTDSAETSSIIENLEPDTSYKFSVAVNTGMKQGQRSEKSDIITTAKMNYNQPEMTPPKPESPKLDGDASCTSVPLTWLVTGDSSCVTHYTLTYKKIGKGNWTLFETDNTHTFCTVDELEPGTFYLFRVASNTKQAQSPSSEVSAEIKTSTKEPIKQPAQTNQAPPVPQQPTLIPGSIGDNCVSLRWQVLSTGTTKDVTHYTLTYKKATSQRFSMTVETKDSNTNCTIDDLDPGTPYHFRVASTTEEGQSLPSKESEIICTLRKPDFKSVIDAKPPTPERPKMIGAAGHNCVTLGWKVMGDTTLVTYYTLGYRAERGNGRWITFETEDANTNYTVEDLEPKTSYRFRVASNTNQGQGPSSDESDVIQTMLCPVIAVSQNPPKPDKPVVDTSGENSVLLHWHTPGKTDSVKNYTVGYRKASTDNKISSWITLETNDANDTFRVDDLEQDTFYQFCVAANTHMGKSPSSEISNITKTPKALQRSEIKRLHPKPGMLTCREQTQNSLTLSWHTFGDSAVNIMDYTISYKAVDDEGKNSCKDNQNRVLNTGSTEKWFTVQDLEPNTSYQIKIAVNTKDGQHFQGDSTAIFTTSEASKTKRTKTEIPSSSSPNSEGAQLQSIVPSQDRAPLATESGKEGKTYCTNLRKRSERVMSDTGLPLFQVPLVLTKRDETQRIQSFDFGIQPSIPKQEKVILVVGATGAGKSTMINGILNFILGVEWSGKYRFRLVVESALFEAQHKSQTRLISIYTLHHDKAFCIPYSLKIIDTPGFGDTDGMSRDRQITEDMRNLFRNSDYGIDHIDAIGFVAESSLARLTPTQKYIFDAVLSLFGKDIAENIYLLITFCDNQKPPLLASIKEANIPFKLHFKFNNSVIFAKTETEESEFDRLFWKMGANSFREFLSELELVEGKSLFLSAEVLDERQRLEVYITGIKDDIYWSLSELDQLKVEMNVVKEHETDMEKNKDFTYKVVENKVVKEHLQKGKYVTNCLICNRTCHYPCSLPNDDRKQCCWAMNARGNCKICRCHWSLHKNDPYRIVVEKVLVNKTSNYLKQRYENTRMNAEKLRRKISDDCKILEIKVLSLIEEVSRCLSRLSEIALRPNPLSTIQYLDILIRSEGTEAQPGYQARIDQLESVKALAVVSAEETRHRPTYERGNSSRSRTDWSDRPRQMTRHQLFKK